MDEVLHSSAQQLSVRSSAIFHTVMSLFADVDKNKPVLLLLHFWDHDSYNPVSSFKDRFLRSLVVSREGGDAASDK